MRHTQHSALACLAITLASGTFSTTIHAQSPAVAASELAPPPSPEVAKQNTVTALESSNLEETFRQADEHFQSADYARAAVLFTRVWQLAQAPENRDRWGRYTAIFAFNAATSHRLAHDCSAAGKAFAQYEEAFAKLTPEQQQALRDATDLPAHNETWRAELHQDCPALGNTENSFPSTPVNNQPLAPTAGQIEEHTTGNWLLDVNVPSNSSARAQPDAPEGSSSHLGWVLTSGGVAALAVSGYFLWSGIQNDNNATEPANKHKPYKDYGGMRNRDYVVASIAGGVGVGLIGVGVYLLAPKSTPQNSRNTLGSGLWLFASGTHVSIGGNL
jgi:hypothetical protein